MLWVLFNKNGQVIYRTNVGNLAFAGTTDYQIYAVYQDIDIADYGTASIKFYKPDLNTTNYLPLLMTKKEGEHGLVYEGEDNEAFTNGEQYDGWLFDFSDYDGEDSSVSLLDTAGLWRAVITLYNAYDSSIRRVVGSVPFDVGLGTEDEDGVELNIESVLTDIYAHLGNYLEKISPDYVKAIRTIAEYNPDNYNIGDIIIDRSTQYIYQVNSEKIPEKVSTIEGGGITIGDVDHNNRFFSIVEDISTEDLSGYNEGKIIYDKTTNCFYKLIGGVWEEFLINCFEAFEANFGETGYELTEEEIKQIKDATVIKLINRGPNGYTNVLLGLAKEEFSRTPSRRHIKHFASSFFVPNYDDVYEKVLIDYDVIEQKLYLITDFSIDLSDFLTEGQDQVYNVIELPSSTTHGSLDSYKLDKVFGKIKCFVRYKNDFYLETDYDHTELNPSLVPTKYFQRIFFNSISANSETVSSITRDTIVIFDYREDPEINAGTWTYVNSASNFYSTSQVRSLLSEKQDNLTFDQTPTVNSNNPVTSAGIKAYVDAHAAVAYTYKGEATVSTINGLGTASSNGDIYQLTDSGTLTQGSLVVDAGDSVIWNGNAWEKFSDAIDTSDFVTKTESQTISGLKTFSGGIEVETISDLDGSPAISLDEYSLYFQHNEEILFELNDYGTIHMLYDTQNNVGNISTNFHNYTLSYGNKFEVSCSNRSNNASEIYLKMFEDEIAISGPEINFYAGNLLPNANGTQNLGSVYNKRWNDLYLKGSVILNNSSIHEEDGDTKNLAISAHSDRMVKFYSGYTIFYKDTYHKNVLPDVQDATDTTETHTLGSASYKWNDLWLSGKITDGIHEVSVADIPDGRMIADEFDVMTAYSIGDYVRHENKLYKAIRDTVAGTAWNIQNWEETNLGDAIDSVHDEVASLSSSLSDYVDLDTDGQEIDSSKRFINGKSLSFTDGASGSQSAFSLRGSSDGRGKNLYLGSLSAAHLKIYQSFTLSQTLLPLNSSSETIGNAANPWASGHFTNLSITDSLTLGENEIDFSDLVDTNTTQRIDGVKTFTSPVTFKAGAGSQNGGTIAGITNLAQGYTGIAMSAGQSGEISITSKNNAESVSISANVINLNSNTIVDGNLTPNSNGTKALGSSSAQWKDLYLTGYVYLQNSSASNNTILYNDASSDFYVIAHGEQRMKMLSGYTIFYKDTYHKSVLPDTQQSGDHNLGSSSYMWNNLYISGNLTDGSNSVSIANIPSAVMIASEFDQTNAYSKDELVRHNGKVYKANNDYVAGTVWNDAGWTETNLGDEINDINVDLSNVITTSGNQTISGDMTFANDVLFTNAVDNTDSKYTEYKWIVGYQSAGDGLYLYKRNTLNPGMTQASKVFEIDSNKNLVIYGNLLNDGSQYDRNLGSASSSWNNLYLDGNIIDSHSNSISVEDLTSRDTTPTVNSTKFVTSGGVYSFVLQNQNTMPIFKHDITITPSGSIGAGAKRKLTIWSTSPTPMTFSNNLEDTVISVRGGETGTELNARQFYAGASFRIADDTSHLGKSIYYLSYFNHQGSFSSLTFSESNGDAISDVVTTINLS